MNTNTPREPEVMASYDAPVHQTERPGRCGHGPLQNPRGRVMNRVMTGVGIEPTTYGLKERRAGTTEDALQSVVERGHGATGGTSAGEAGPKRGGVSEKVCCHYESLWASHAEQWVARRQGMRLTVRPYGMDWEAIVEAGRWARPAMILRTREAAQRWCEWMADRLAMQRSAAVGVGA